MHDRSAHWWQVTRCLRWADARISRFSRGPEVSIMDAKDNILSNGEKQERSWYAAKTSMKGYEHNTEATTKHFPADVQDRCCMGISTMKISYISGRFKRKSIPIVGGQNAILHPAKSTRCCWSILLFRSCSIPVCLTAPLASGRAVVVTDRERLWRERETRQYVADPPRLIRYPTVVFVDSITKVLQESTAHRVSGNCFIC